MIIVETWTQIREMYFIKGMSMRKIAKTLGVNRRTVKRAIEVRGGPRYERSAPYPSLLNPFKWEIHQMIESTHGEILATVIYQRLICRQVTSLTPRYRGSYETLLRYVREIKQQLKPKEAFLQIETPAGFDAQCDWGKVDLVIADKAQKVSMFVLKLSYSRYRFACLFFLERQECFFEGHIQAFKFFEGIPKQVTYDNLTTAVLKILKGKARVQQQAFIRFRGEFPFLANFAAPKKGNEKGKVESDIKYIRNHAFALRDEFATIDEANAHLLLWLKKDVLRVHGTHKEVILARYEREKPHLNPLIEPLPEGCRVVYAKVNKFSFVQFETNRYSVPTEYVSKTVMVKASAMRIKVVFIDKVIAQHPRLFTRDAQQVNVNHFLSLLEKKARAVDHAVIMQAFNLDPIFYQLKQKFAGAVENPNRQWIKVLRLMEQYPMQKVAKAVKTALAYDAFDYASIKNFLLQQVYPSIDIGQQNCLTDHPQLAAVVVCSIELSRYDALLSQPVDKHIRGDRGEEAK